MYVLQVFTCYLKPDTTWFKYEILVDVFGIQITSFYAHHKTLNRDISIFVPSSVSIFYSPPFLLISPSLFTDIVLEYWQRSIVYGRVPTTTNDCEVTGLRQTLLTDAVKWTTPGEDPILKTSWTSPILTLTQELEDYTKDKV